MPQHFPSFDSSISLKTDFTEKLQLAKTFRGSNNEEFSTLRHRAHRIGNHKLNFNRKQNFTYDSSTFDSISKVQNSKQYSSFRNNCTDSFKQQKSQNKTDNSLTKKKGSYYEEIVSEVLLFQYESASNCEDSCVKSLVTSTDEKTDEKSKSNDLNSENFTDSGSKCFPVPLLPLENSPPPLNIPSLRMGTPRSPHTPPLSGNASSNSTAAHVLVRLPAENITCLSTFQDLPSMSAPNSLNAPLSNDQMHHLSLGNNANHPITTSPVKMLVSNPVPHMFATPPRAPTVHPITYSPSCSVSQQCKFLPTYNYPPQTTAKLNAVEQTLPDNNLKKQNALSTNLNGMFFSSPKGASTVGAGELSGSFTNYQAKDLSWTPTYPLQTVRFPNFQTSGTQLSPLPPPLLPYPSLLYTCSGNQTKTSQPSVNDFTLHHSPAVTSSVLNAVYTQPLEIAVCTPPQHRCQPSFPFPMPLNTTFATASQQFALGAKNQAKSFNHTQILNNSFSKGSLCQDSFQQHYQNVMNSQQSELTSHEQPTIEDFNQRETKFEVLDSQRRKNDVRLFVGRIPKWYTSKELKKLFEAFGPLCECSIIRDRYAAVSQGCGFVRFYDIKDACAAITALNQNVVLHPDLGPVQVKFATGELKRLKLPLSFQPGGECVKVFIGNLSTNTTEDELCKVFGAFGPFEELCILRDKYKRSKCSGFVIFNSTEDAESAILALDGRYYLTGANRPLEVRFAESKSRQEFKSSFTPVAGTVSDITYGSNFNNENTDFFGKNSRSNQQIHRQFRKYKNHPISHNDRML